VNDDEVMQWLSDEEREAFRSVPMPDNRVWSERARAALRALAETRATLVEFEWSEFNDRGGTETSECRLCGQRGYQPTSKHEPTCIFATMPRPR
jgi:hypothetical protein